MKIYVMSNGKKYRFADKDVPAEAVLFEPKKAEEKSVEPKAKEVPNKAKKPVNKAKKAATK